MKLTPEQKASFEYGFEKGRLRMAIDTIRRRAWERHGARYGEVVFPVRELVWNEFNIKGIIACVRRSGPRAGRGCPWRKGNAGLVVIWKKTTVPRFARIA